MSSSSARGQVGDALDKQFLAAGLVHAALLRPARPLLLQVVWDSTLSVQILCCLWTVTSTRRTTCKQPPGPTALGRLGGWGSSRNSCCSLFCSLTIPPPSSAQFFPTTSLSSCPPSLSLPLLSSCCRPVKIIRLAARHTVDQIIIQRAAAKMELTSTVIEGGQVRGAGGRGRLGRVDGWTCGRGHWVGR